MRSFLPRSKNLLHQNLMRTLLLLVVMLLSKERKANKKKTTTSKSTLVVLMNLEKKNTLSVAFGTPLPQ